MEVEADGGDLRRFMYRIWISEVNRLESTYICRQMSTFRSEMNAYLHDRSRTTSSYTSPEMDV